MLILAKAELESQIEYLKKFDASLSARNVYSNRFEAKPQPSTCKESDFRKTCYV
jgi:hypothetical protein